MPVVLLRAASLQRIFGTRCINHHQEGIAGFDCCPTPSTPSSLNLIRGLPQPGGISQPEEHALDKDSLLQRVTGRSWKGCNNCPPRLKKRIEDAGFPGVGTPDDCHGDTLAEYPTQLKGVSGFLKCLLQPSKPPQELRGCNKINTLLREVNLQLQRARYNPSSSSRTFRTSAPTFPLSCSIDAR